MFTDARFKGTGLLYLETPAEMLYWEIFTGEQWSIAKLACAVLWKIEDKKGSLKKKLIAGFNCKQLKYGNTY